MRLPGLTLTWISLATGGLGLAVIGIGSIAIGMSERETILREARDHAQSSAFFLADHAQRLFEVSDIALRSTTQSVGDLDWGAIDGNRLLWSTLKETSELLPFVGNVWLNDETGRLRLTTFNFETPDISLANRPFFQRLRDTDDPIVISSRTIGTLTKLPTVFFGRRLSGPDGRFKGTASVTLDLAYFTNYWRRLTLPNNERIAVVRATGDVLASFQGGRESSLETMDAALLQAIAANPEEGAFTPERWTSGFYHRIGDLPLYVTVEFTRASIAAAWHRWLYRFTLFAGAAFLGLATIMVLGFRQGRRETAAAREIAAARLALVDANQNLERRVAERTAALSESNEEIQRFAYVVSHDLRAPLVNITGFTSELEGLREPLFDAASDSDPAETRRDFDEALGFIRLSIDKMDRLIKAILALSRQNQRSVQIEPIDLSALTQTVVDTFAHRVHTNGIAIQLAPLPTLNSDRIAVEQILTNVVDNAIKYLRPDVPGAITIRGRATGTGAVVEIADNGRGIALKDRERVFELFRRAGPQDQPGEGIGLAHVRGLTRRLGGRITLDSEPGKGSVFVIELPNLERPKSDMVRA